MSNPDNSIGHLTRFIRQKDVPDFFGVGRGYFDKSIRPSLIEIRLGDTPQSGIVYDIFDLHALADTMKLRNGRPVKKGEDRWDVKQQESNSLKEKIPPIGTLRERSSESELEEALGRHRKKKQP